VRWTVVIPAKALPAAKSRLLPATTDLAAHRRLVEAIRADTAAAAAAAANVARVLVVVDRPDPEWQPPGPVLVQSAPGLNAALAEAAAHAAGTWPADAVAVLVGDLPALRADDLAAALDAAAGFDRAFVRDADGTGTTVLTARAGVVLQPAFGDGSAARHARTAQLIDAAPGLRHDVDTAADLQAAHRLGLGARTAAALAMTGSEGEPDVQRPSGVGACSP
jgi:2-phospho-L-lactate/phosphoenolpyruvate guanylyltransferase